MGVRNSINEAAVYVINAQPEIMETQCKWRAKYPARSL